MVKTRTQDQQIPRHAGREHRHPNAQDQRSSKVLALGGKGEKADVPGGLPPAAPALLLLCSLGGWTDGGVGDGNLEEVRQSPDHQVESTLLKDMWVRQE